MLRINLIRALVKELSIMVMGTTTWVDARINLSSARYTNGGRPVVLTYVLPTDSVCRFLSASTSKRKAVGMICFITLN